MFAWKSEQIIAELTRIVDEAGGVENFTHAIVEFGDLEKVTKAIRNPTTANDIVQLNSKVSIVEPNFHTGRFEINSLNEQLALREIFSNPIENAKLVNKKGPLGDLRLPDPREFWNKYERVIRLNGENITVHFDYNISTKKITDIKFK